MKNLTIYILAGGKSSRMGTDKGLLPLDEKPMIKYLLETVKELTSTIFIVSNNKKYEQFGYQVIPDLITNKGPVGGIYTALANSKTENNIILSCDTPFVSLELLTLLIDKSNGVEVCIPSHNTKKHPLIGIYKTKALPIFKKCIETNTLKLMVVNEKLNYKIVGLTKQFNEREFYNFNSMEDLIYLLK